MFRNKVEISGNIRGFEERGGRRKREKRGRREGEERERKRGKCFENEKEKKLQHFSGGLKVCGGGNKK